MSILANFDGFDFPIRESDGYWNLTAMCQKYEKRVNDFLRLDSTKEFLKTFETEGFTETGQERIGNPVEIIKGGNDRSLQGTWGHPQLGQECLFWCQKNTRKTCSVLGCIYVLLDPGNNAYKIGFTTNLKARLKQHSCSNPFLEVVKVYEGMTIETEETIHLALSKYKVPGSIEWYFKKPAVLRILSTIINSVES